MARDIRFLMKDELRNEMRYPVGLYLTQNLERINYMAKFTEEELNKEDINLRKTINLVCRGSSGAIVAAIMLQHLASKNYMVRINHVKKEGESSHSNALSIDEDDINIIVDDFVSSGKTMNNIYAGMCSQCLETPTVHMMVVTGTFDADVLKFEPKILISGGAF